MLHRFVLGQLPVLAALAGLAAGCGAGAATGDLDKIQVTMGRFEISVTNTSGNPLLEVVAEIVPVGPSSHFVARPQRLETGETRTIAHTSFMDHDSVPFSPRTARADRVTVTARDMNGKVVHVDLPFKS